MYWYICIVHDCVTHYVHGICLCRYVCMFVHVSVDVLVPDMYPGIYCLKYAGVCQNV